MPDATRTALHSRCVAALEKWCKKRSMKLKAKPRHIHPRCYVITRGKGHLVIAQCWADAEPHLLEDEREHRQLTFADIFDDSLHGGKWCTVGYLVTEMSGEHIAIPVVP